MNEQFKFGDRVARKNATPDYDKAFIVISAKDNGEICVFSSISKLPFDVQAKDYQLVPHSDTVRLDWLLENAGINVGEEDYYRRNYVYDRAAIDAAMNKEKNND